MIKKYIGLVCGAVLLVALAAGCSGAFGFDGKNGVLDAGGEQSNMVYVEGGIFQMGSNTGPDEQQPLHQVRVSSFYIGKYEVTQAEYEEIMGSNPSRFKSRTSGDMPVDSVSWSNAVKYCNKRSEAEGFAPCYTVSENSIICDWNANGYRLPSEAEWEYAARGGKHHSAYQYSGSNDIDEVAWSGEGNTEFTTYTVGMKKNNALGIFDMSGNVWEWCWDWYDRDYYSNSTAENPYGPISSPSGERVARGGCFANNAAFCECIGRWSFKESTVSDNVGFRVVRSIR